MKQFEGKIESRKIKLSYFKRKGLYRKYVDGRMFYLGPDKVTAQKLAAVIFVVRDRRKLDGGTWQEEDLEFIRMAKEELYQGRGRMVLKARGEHFELIHESTNKPKRGTRSGNQTTVATMSSSASSSAPALQ
jgi:hypothetical protein